MAQLSTSISESSTSGYSSQRPCITFFPKPAAVEHIALFHRAKTFSAFSCRFKSDSADSLDFGLAVFENVGGNVALCLMLSEINSADKLANYYKINSLVHNGFFSAARRRQAEARFLLDDYSNKPHAGAKAQQALFGAHITGDVVPFISAHRAEQHAVRADAFSSSL